MSRSNRNPIKAGGMPLPASVAPEMEAEEVGEEFAEAEEAPVEAPKPAPKKAKEPVFPCQVVALRKGFYKQVRRNIGDEFTCEKKEQLGSWMKVL